MQNFYFHSLLKLNIFLSLTGLLIFLLILKPDMALADIVISNPTANPVPSGITKTAIYLIIHNESDNSYNLRSAKITDKNGRLIAEKIIIEHSFLKNGLWSLEAIHNLNIAPRQTITMSPGDLHLTAINLKRALKRQEKLTLTLSFLEGKSISKQLTVTEPKLKTITPSVNDEYYKPTPDRESIPILISSLRVRPTMPRRNHTAIHLTIENKTDKTIYLLKADSAIAQSIVINKGVLNREKMGMKNIEKIKIPARKKIKLIPGGIHLKISGLSRNLMEGDEVPLTLYFSNGKELKVSAPVKKTVPK